MRPIGTRWVDTNKGDKANPKIRSRLVAQELNRSKMPELCAATPPLEFIKFLISLCATSQWTSRPARLMVCDVKKAYFDAAATRRVFVALPAEDVLPGEAHMCGLLQRSLYGTRDAAQNWTQTYTRVLCDALGFEKGSSSPCSFYHKRRQVHLVVHGDDFFVEGDGRELRSLNQQLQQHFELKTENLAPDAAAGEVQEIRFLNRVLRWTQQGLTWEADPRHSEMVVRQLGLENSRSVATPGVKEGDNKTMRDDSATPNAGGDCDNLLCALSAVDSADFSCDDDNPFGINSEIDLGSAVPQPTCIESVEGWAPGSDEASPGGPADNDQEATRRSPMAKLSSQHDVLLDAGWSPQSNGSYVRRDNAAEKFRVPPVDGMYRRITRDANTRQLIEDLQLQKHVVRRNVGGSREFDRRVNRVLKMPKDIETEMYVLAVDDAQGEDDPLDAPLDPKDASIYRAIVARINFLAADRSDVQFASKECSRRMSSPCLRDWGAVKRIGRYLLGRPRAVQHFDWQDRPACFSVYSDSNWAGCKATRKSTSGACLLWGGHVLKSYSRTQSNIALSSGEAELYATVTAASEGLGLTAMARDFGMEIRSNVHVDATAATGIAERKGLGKVRHLDTQSL